MIARIERLWHLARHGRDPFDTAEWWVLHTRAVQVPGGGWQLGIAPNATFHPLEDAGPFSRLLGFELTAAENELAADLHRQIFGDGQVGHIAGLQVIIDPTVPKDTMYLINPRYTWSGPISDEAGPLTEDKLWKASGLERPE